ncbi:MAG: CRISPR system precrRNA processing endoribonuclease RAMP protein Cas6 [Acidobacteriia bacterium]|nr:CRISPR system precrRNA processing endoribonuclease RAMP protein Cas6 [Terriglobia bacterium]
MTTLAFFRFRCHFRALEAVHFPPGKAGNAVRGAFGSALHETASPAVYARLFAPGSALGKSPAGLADWPRPFVLRAAALAGVTFSAGARFHFDVHVFDTRAPVLPYFRRAFAQLAEQGIGSGRGRVRLEFIEQVDLADRVQPVNEEPRPPAVIPLDPEPAPVERVYLRFVTPTELKSAGVVAAQPEFPVLFGRLRDRIGALSALYGAGPLGIDFRGMGERAAAVRLCRTELAWETAERRSSRTGQVHPLGGFTGEAEYQGPLTEFLPWLRAARWCGVGRQTVWGKGDVRVIAPQNDVPAVPACG